MSFVENVCQPSTLRMLIWPEASNAQNSMAAVSADGSTVCVLIVQSFDRIGSPRAPPLARRQSCEGEQPVTGFLQAVGDGAVLEPPFAVEGHAARLDLLTRRCIDHIVVIRGDLVMQALWRVREKVPVLVDRAAADRHAVPASLPRNP